MASVIIPAAPASRDPAVWNTLADAVEAYTFGAGAIAREAFDARSFERGAITKRLGGSRQYQAATLALTSSWSEPALTGRPWTGATGPHSVPAGSIARVRASIAFETSHAVPPVYGLPVSGIVSVRLVTSVGGVQSQIPGALVQLGGALRGPPTTTQVAQGAHSSIVLEGWSTVEAPDYYAIEVKGSTSLVVRVVSLAISARLYSRAT